jgi:alpha-2-macroglobulin
MRRSVFSIVFTFTVVAFSFIIFESCKRSDAEGVKSITVDPAFREFIDGFTTGHISTESGIIVRFNFDVADSSMINQDADPTLFVFKPDIKGKATWIDTRTIKFQPYEKLPNNSSYTVQFNLTKLVDVPDSLKTMTFNFHTIAQDFDVILEHSRAYSSNDLSNERLTGYILTSDIEEIEKIQNLITVQQNKKSLPVSWSQDESKRRHLFTIDSISRGSSESTVTVSYNGRAIGVDKKGTLKHTIYPINIFKVTHLETKRFPEEVIIVRFSDPLNEEQEMDGKISMGKFFDFSYVINFNELHIYPASSITDEDYLSIRGSIQNHKGNTMGKAFSQLITFKDIAPNVRFTSKGTILPSSNGLIIPFEAINLQAVDVRIIQIFQNNIPQFLQVNTLSGTGQMSRVGRTVLRKTIPLGQVANNNVWNKYYLDIAELIQTQPGAIYTVELSFRKEHATLDCIDNEGVVNEVYSYFNEVSDDADDNWEYMSGWGDYYDDYYYYNWHERDDPCSNSYYYGKKVRTNVLATDIGLIAKTGETGDLYIFATNIINAEPMREIEIEVMNYQLQTITKSVTDANGMCKVKTHGKPYLIIAKKGKQQSYLKMGEGNSLSLSSFDVSGERVQNGLKGFIYGERGVWRPGDSLYVTFMLEDALNQIPKEHPVIFELYNPLGNLIEKRPVNNNLNGFYAFHTATTPDAETGLYRLIVRVGKNSFTHHLRIETVKPNRLRIDVDPGGTYISLASLSNVTIESQWLHGAVAKELKVESEVEFRNMKTSFNKFPKFIFDDPSKQISSERFSFYKGNLDELGFVSFTPTLDMEDAPGFVMANIETRVYEPGGEYSVDFLSVPISPFKSYVGILPPSTNDKTPYLFTDRNYSFKIVNIQENQRPSKSSHVNIEIYKIEWRYWWSSYNTELSDFMYSLSSEPIESKKISLKNGVGSYSMKVENKDWGRYYIKVTDIESGHSTGIVQFFDWYGYNRFTDDDKTAAAMLTLSTDKPSYKVGDDIKIAFDAPKGARAYITIENGSGVMETHQVTEVNNMIEFKAKAGKEMSPNVYISVVMIQPHANTVDGLPIRMYGVVPVFVEDPETILKPVIQSANVFRPGQRANVVVAESSGKEMTYTLAIVDEGLLNLTRFKTPDPHAKFYSREALGVRTYDIYDDVIGAWGGQIQRVLSIGGGDDIELDPTGQRANRFKPMVRFIGPIHLPKGKTNTHLIDIPEYIGSVRIMVVAGQNKAYGNAEKSVTVRNPLMLLGTAPRVIGPGEKFRLPVSVFAMEENIKNVQITIQTNNLFQVTGDRNKKLNFSKTGEQLSYFDIQTSKALGVGQILITAESGNEKAIWKIELDVRPSNPRITEVISATVNEGDVWENEVTPIGIKGTNTNTLEVSTFIPMNIDKWLTYLLNYPHHCTEQTISGAFPMLYANSLSDGTEAAMEMAEKKVKFAINRIQNMQLGSGGIAMWPRSQYADDWTTSYAGHFLIEAQQLGYVISKPFMRKWKSYQKNKAKNWKHDRSRYNNDLMQAYRLYTLAIAGSPETGTMNRLSELTFLSPQAKWLLASAYSVIGRDDAAKKLIAKTTTNILSYSEYGYTYGSHTRDKAFILETYLRLGMTNNALTILQEIANDLGTSRWLSTQTAAQTLRAVAIYLKYFPSGKQMDFIAKLNNEATTHQSRNMTHTMPMGTNAKEKVSIENKGEGTLYIRIIQSGIPLEVGGESVQNNLNMSVSYKSLDGRELNPLEIVQGTVFYADITITHPGELNGYSSMALTQIFPSGWEIMSDRLAFGDNTTNQLTYQDIRDDRVLSYFNLSKSQTIQIRTRLSASYIGIFQMPMIYCEAMYNNRVNASIAGKWVKVIDPNENASSNEENSP